jgi:recombinational DNA repair protein (RecF pathway)
MALVDGARRIKMPDIELLIKTFEIGMMRRSGIRCDMNMCARVASKLRELQELKERGSKNE